MIKSHAHVFSDFDTTWYKYWARELKQDVKDTGKFMPQSNKFWQNAVILQVLKERGVLKPDKHGIGFGVGQERLPAVLAKHGVLVTATDQDFRTTKAKHWQENELAKNLDDLNDLRICPARTFKKQVTLMPIDMKNVPSKLYGAYDFVWSNCALGHLGSIQAGLDFIEASAKCLKPGGVAVHTTEMNILSNDETVTSGDTVVFRPRDFLALSQRLTQAGYNVSPLRAHFGSSEKDHRVTMTPTFGNDYSKLHVGGHLLTQVVFIVQRPKRSLGHPLKDLRLKRAHTYSVKQQQKLAQTNPFIAGIRANEAHPLAPGDIEPIKAKLSVKLEKGKPKSLLVAYRNKTNFPMFNAHEKLHSTQPIVLATNDPEDRTSKFQAKDWHSPPRPSLALHTKSESTWVPASFVQAGEDFAFKLTLDPRKVKPGTYTETFSVAHEGVAHLPDTKVQVKITVI